MSLYFRVCLFLCLIGFCTTVTFGQSVYSITLETALRTELFSSYSTQQRPNKQVLVYADLTLLTVNDMVKKIQSITLLLCHYYFYYVNNTFTVSILLSLSQYYFHYFNICYFPLHLNVYYKFILFLQNIKDQTLSVSAQLGLVWYLLSKLPRCLLSFHINHKLSFVDHIKTWAKIYQSAPSKIKLEIPDSSGGQ